jgi:hypothetical protein
LDLQDVLINNFSNNQMVTQHKRKEKDLMKLMMSNFEVTLTDENNQNDFNVIFQGPKESSYEGVINILSKGYMESPCPSAITISI